MYKAEDFKLCQLSKDANTILKVEIVFIQGHHLKKGKQGR